MMPPTPSARTFALACALAAVIAWSSAFVGIRFVLQEIPPGPVVFLRFAVASACFLLLFTLGHVRRPTRSDVPKLVGIGVLGQGVYQFALSVAQTRITAGAASVMIALTPVLSALFAMPVLREKLTGRAWLGMALAFAGAAVISIDAPGGIGFEPEALLGLVAAAASAGYFVLQKPWLDRYSAIDLTAYGVWTGAMAALVFTPALPHVLTSASTPALMTVLYLGIVPTALGYTLWAFALARIPAGEVTSLLYLEPVATFLLAWALLSEVPTPEAVAGALLALAGVALVTGKPRSKLATPCHTASG